MQCLNYVALLSCTCLYNNGLITKHSHAVFHHKLTMHTDNIYICRHNIGHAA